MPRKLHLDIAQSSGVIGFNRHAGALYVTLDPAVPDAIVALTQSPPDPRQRFDRPYLADSRWQISRLKVGGCGFEAEAKGFGPGEMTWGGLRPGNFTVSHKSRDGDVEIVREAVADQSGTITHTIEADAINGLKFKVACARTPPLQTGTAGR